MRTDPSHHVDTVKVGHHQVDQDKVGFEFCEDALKLSKRRAGRRVEPQPLRHHRHGFTDRRIVIKNDQAPH